MGRGLPSPSEEPAAGEGASDDAVRCWITEARREAAPDEDSAIPWDELETDATVRAFFWSLARRAHEAGKKHQASADAATIAGLLRSVSSGRQLLDELLRRGVSGSDFVSNALSVLDGIAEKAAHLRPEPGGGK